MHQWNAKDIVMGTVAAMLLAGSSVQAQTAEVATEPRWGVEFGIGWDNSISGNINSSGIGSLDNQAVVITKNTYEDVYGTGLSLRFGAGYMIDDDVEVRAMFTLQSLDADLTPMGDLGISNLYGQYADYQSFALDVGMRWYRPVSTNVRAYGEGTVGLGFIDETDVILVAPQANLAGRATDFYDSTAAMSLGGNVGFMVRTGPQISFFGQVGLRWMSGMSEIDDLEGTGLETINDKSSRWTMPFLIGIRGEF